MTRIQSPDADSSAQSLHQHQKHPLIGTRPAHPVALVELVLQLRAALRDFPGEKREREFCKDILFCLLSNSPRIVAQNKDLAEHAALIDEELEEHQFFV